MKLLALWDRYCPGPPPADLAARPDLTLFGVSEDSRDVRFGYLFCAIPGTRVNGLDFCAQAAAKGAQAIAVPAGTPPERLGLSDYEREKIAILPVPDVRQLYARLAAAYHPGRPGTLAAVTGTNGKTSTVGFLRDLWTEAGHQAVSLGTLGVRARDAVLTDLEAVMTTFDPKTLHIILGSLARDEGVSHLALEASSHALDQQRLSGLELEAAGFTNLSQDHLDYHGTMEAYFAAKARLFHERLSPSGTAAINLGDPYGARLAEQMHGTRRVIGFRADDGPADLRLRARQSHAAGQRLTLTLFGRTETVDAPVAGLFQGENILCALALALATGVPAQAALAACSALTPVPGRMEQVAVTDTGAAVYVDYAHTPDALDKVLVSLRPHLGPGARLHLVFGCGGDRDAGKRPLMGQVAQRLADRVYITDDNPRTEDPGPIRAAIRAGCPEATDLGDRGRAIAAALEGLGAGDVLLIAGKGHEDYQIVADGAGGTAKQPFSDVKTVRGLLGLDPAKAERG